MPQIFQVLNCYKCSVFQVHQTKKSNKWECKLCGEKQSIKRHYGLGTGKECRLHVQKLNGIRGEVNELNESNKLSKSSDEELELKHESDSNYEDLNTEILTKKKNESKWLSFIDKTEAVQELEANETMYLGNTEVVLEIPAKKRRKFNTPKVIHKSTVYRPFQEIESLEVNEKERLQHEIFLNSDLSVPNSRSTFCNVNSSKLNNTILSKPEIAKTESYCSAQNTEIDKLTVNKQEANKTRILDKTKSYVPPKVNKSSKWAQFTGEPEENEKNSSLSRENSEFIPNNLFSLCDEEELDDVLDF